MSKLVISFIMRKPLEIKQQEKSGRQNVMGSKKGINHGFLRLRANFNRSLQFTGKNECQLRIQRQKIFKNVILY